MSRWRRWCLPPSLRPSSASVVKTTLTSSVKRWLAWCLPASHSPWWVLLDWPRITLLHVPSSSGQAEDSSVLQPVSRWLESILVITYDIHFQICIHSFINIHSFLLSLYIIPFYTPPPPSGPSTPLPPKTTLTAPSPRPTLQVLRKLPTHFLSYWRGYYHWLSLESHNVISRKYNIKMRSLIWIVINLSLCSFVVIDLKVLFLFCLMFSIHVSDVDCSWQP